jgi:hypothetical protein
MAMSLCDRAVQQTAGLFRCTLATPHVGEDNPGTRLGEQVPLSELPMVAAGAAGPGCVTTRHFVDVIDNVQIVADKAALSQMALTNKLVEAPAPFGLRAATPVLARISLAIIRKPDGSTTVIKHVELQDRVKMEYAANLCYGALSVPNWGVISGNFASAVKAFHFLFEELGGFQIRCFGLLPCRPKEVPLQDANEVDAGFDFIMAHAPRSAVNLAQMRWSTKQIHDPASPIFNWPVALVDKAMHQLSNEGSLASTHKFFSLTMADFEGEVMKFAETAFRTRKLKSLWLLGVSGVAKTPFAYAYAMAVSRESGDLEGPYFRTSSELDFYRGEIGREGRPDIFDDGDVSTQPVKVLKAFTDVSCAEGAIWARWGGCRWPQGCARIVADNKVDLDAELPDNRGLRVPHANFLELVRPAFPEKINQSDLQAVLKRSHFVVQTRKYIYFREAGEGDRDVERVALDDRKQDWIKESSKPKYEAWLKGDRTPPARYQEFVTWERRWADHVLRAGPPPAPMWQIRTVGLDGRPGPVVDGIPPDQQRFNVKREAQSAFYRALRGHHGAVIDLSDEESPGPGPSVRRRTSEGVADGARAGPSAAAEFVAGAERTAGVGASEDLPPPAAAAPLGARLPDEIAEPGSSCDPLLAAPPLAAAAAQQLPASLPQSDDSVGAFWAGMDQPEGAPGAKAEVADNAAGLAMAIDAVVEVLDSEDEGEAFYDGLAAQFDAEEEPAVEGQPY